VALLALAASGACGHRADYDGVQLTDAPLMRSLDREALLRASTAAVAIVETDVGRGMGFVVDPDGYLITARHVVEDADHVDAVIFPSRDPSRRYESVQVVYTDPRLDVALLHVTTSEALPYLPVATEKIEPVSRYLSAADPVVLLERDTSAAGINPGLLVRRGRVRDLEVFNPAAGPKAFVGVTQDVEQGQSGGPVLDRDGRAVGLVTWTWRDRIGGYAIPISDVAQMLAQRPRLSDLASHRTRVQQRARSFVDALVRADLDGAKSLSSPTHARKLREETLSEIFSGDEAPPMLGLFIAAVDELAQDKPETDAQLRVQIDALNEIVSRASASTFREAVGLAGHVRPGQARSFFRELGQSYMFARMFGGMDAEPALGAALQRLRTVDAARTFAVADAVERIGPAPISLVDVTVLPGEYAPTAVARLRQTDATAPAREFKLQLRLEWGDWYVAEVAPGLDPNPATGSSDDPRPG
jgi:hypothetical protein